MATVLEPSWTSAGQIPDVAGPQAGLQGRGIQTLQGEVLQGEER